MKNQQKPKGDRSYEMFALLPALGVVEAPVLRVDREKGRPIVVVPTHDQGEDDVLDHHQQQVHCLDVEKKARVLRSQERPILKSEHPIAEQ